MFSKIKGFFKRRSFNLQTTIIFVVCCSTLVSLIVSAILIRNFILNRNDETTNEKISSVAKIVSTNEIVKEGLLNGDSELTVQSFAADVMKAANLDFVVVMDTDMIRLSHAAPSYIGQKFSDEEDAKKVLSGEAFFSRKIGVLGNGYRYFVPVVNDGEIIGGVCVGLTSQSMGIYVSDAQKKILLSLLLGLTVGIIGAVFLAQKMKTILLGLEPEEIAAQLSEKEIIENEVEEGLIAISPTKQIILLNRGAKELFATSSLEMDSQLGEVIDENLYEVLFKATLEEKTEIRNQYMYLNGIEVIASVSPIFSEEQFFGAVATLRDQSEMMKLLEELGGTEQYINSLRAQTHEFLNKLHVISGLIDLEKFDEVSEFVQQLNHHYTVEVGYITKLIKVPAIAGFLLGKINEAKEQQVEMILADDSYVPEMLVDESVHALLQILGNLLDNAKEAVLKKGEGQVRIHLTFEEEGQLFILEVCDDGIGLSKEAHQQLFNVGFSTKGENRGFGLNIVKRIIEEYDGVIEFSSRKTGGTVVYLELPNKVRKKK
ncbi:ATP-binding protein [Enterococcus sp. BWR-S5]|uniref:ATP-binding protein n=1 Tax=Enterococcus sp. BWR-S5 TaxID=2787714 RepID=UPI001F16732D|nr:ATP-binding protein [Enterococcus sp. BWR-S5]